MTTAPERRTATLTELVAQEIDSARGRRRMSQAQLARVMGKTPMWVSLRLRGMQPIDLNDLLLFARALDVDVHDLMPAREAIMGVTAQPNERSAAPAPRRTRSRRTDEPRRGRLVFESADREPQGPFGPNRQRSTRPTSGIPASSRRPTAGRPANRTMAA